MNTLNSSLGVSHKRGLEKHFSLKFIRMRKTRANRCRYEKFAFFMFFDSLIITEKQNERGHLRQGCFLHKLSRVVEA